MESEKSSRTEQALAWGRRHVIALVVPPATAAVTKWIFPGPLNETLKSLPALLGWQATLALVFGLFAALWVIEALLTKSREQAAQIRGFEKKLESAAQCRDPHCPTNCPPIFFRGPRFEAFNLSWIPQRRHTGGPEAEYRGVLPTCLECGSPVKIEFDHPTDSARCLNAKCKRRIVSFSEWVGEEFKAREVFDSVAAEAKRLYYIDKTSFVATREEL